MEDVIEEIRRFRDERDWKQFHNPKDLAISISIEAAELLEQFQWKSAGEVEKHVAGKKEQISDEVADVAIYLFELADILGIDVKEAIRAKLKKNALKYPVEKAKGVSTKYTDLK
jgi:NTP pyrophosphatase (non-canonical NTP hydrolase)